MDSSEDRTDEIQENGDLSSSDSGNESTPSAAGGNIGKTAVIAIIVIIAGTLAAHALLTDNECDSADRCGGSLALLNAAEQQAGAACCPSEEKIDAACPTTAEKSCDKAYSGEVKTCPFGKTKDNVTCAEAKSGCSGKGVSPDTVVDCPLTNTEAK